MKGSIEMGRTSIRPAEAMNTTLRSTRWTNVAKNAAAVAPPWKYISDMCLGNRDGISRDGEVNDVRAVPADVQQQQSQVDVV